MQSPSVPARLRRSRHLSWFAHMGAVYLFHDLYGYLMEMSPDIAQMIDGFGGGVDRDRAVLRRRHFPGHGGGQWRDGIALDGIALGGEP